MLSRHRRFLAALALGAGAAVALAGENAGFRALVGIDLFSASYLILMAHFAARLTVRDLERHAAEADEGIWVILLLALAVVALSVALVYVALGSDQPARPVEVVLTLLGIPLCWAMLQTLLALRYSHLYYAPAPAPVRGDRARTGGLDFGGTPDPGLWDFLYFSFTVGMTAQVSDTVVRSTRIRRMVLGHAVLSFFYNTVLLALAVNAGIALAR